MVEGVGKASGQLARSIRFRILTRAATAPRSRFGGRNASHRFQRQNARYGYPSNVSMPSDVSARCVAKPDSMNRVKICPPDWRRASARFLVVAGVPDRPERMLIQPPKIARAKCLRCGLQSGAAAKSAKVLRGGVGNIASTIRFARIASALIRATIARKQESIARSRAGSIRGVAGESTIAIAPRPRIGAFSLNSEASQAIGSRRGAARRSIRA